MVINTRDFGKVEILEENILTFSRSIYGFNGLNKFIRLTDEELGDGIVWLQSVEDAAICFIMIDIGQLGLEYSPSIDAESSALLELDEEAPKFYAIATFKDNMIESYMNLKSPIIVNEVKKLAIQEIVEEDYPLRFPLYESEE